jgi:hypothetical protein
MSILQHSVFLRGINHNHDTFSDAVVSAGKQQHDLLQPKSSLANLINLVRNPLETVGGTVEHWRNGSTNEERVRKQSLQDKKQLLYLKLREVRLSKWVDLRAHMLTKILGNEL